MERIPGFLYLRISSDITTLDPAMIVDVTGGSLAAKIFNGLVRFGDDSKVIPDLAEKFNISEDGKTYKFYLRKGIRFHNGRELTSVDIKYSFERVMDPDCKSSRTWVFDRISGAKEFMTGKAIDVSGIKILDDYTVEIELREPFGPFLDLLAMPSAYIVPKEEIEKNIDEFSSNPVGTGPFKLKEWKRGRELVFIANEYYFSEKAKIKGIIYRIIPEDLTTIAEFESGRLDVMGVPSTEFRRYSESEKWKGLIKKGPGLNTFYLGLNCQKAPFNDKRVRQALNYAVDRERILKTILEGGGELANGPVPPFLVTHPSPQSSPSEGRGSLSASSLALWERVGVRVGYTYDPNKTRALLKEAGYENKLKFRIYQSADLETADIMEVVQQYLRDVGVEAEIVQLEWSAFKEAINKGEADSFWLSWKADYPDPENFLFPVFHSSNWGAAGNRARFKDPETDRLIDEAQREPDEEKRKSLYLEAEKRVLEEAPWLFFWHKNEYLIHHPWVRDLNILPIYNADKGTSTILTK